MINVIPMEIAAPMIMQQNKYIRQIALTLLLGGIPKILKIDFLPTRTIRRVAMTQRMANMG